jgi:large subunit ribosomal protein L12
MEGKAMEYVYSAMLLHSVGKDINEANVEGVLTAAGAKPDKARVKALVASLDGVDIEEAMKTSVALPGAAPAAAGAAPAEGQAADKKDDDKKDEEEEKVTEEEAASGLGALFG